MRLCVIHGIIAGTLLIVACSEDMSSAPTEFAALPDEFRVVGEAVGEDSKGRTAECSMDLLIELHDETRRNAKLVENEGIYGGGLQRTVLDHNGDGISLMPDVYGEVVARLYPPDSVELLFPANVDTGSRFWDALGLLAGAWSGQGGSGVWTCAPFDILEGGWVDTSLVAAGAWRIELLGETY